MLNSPHIRLLATVLILLLLGWRVKVYREKTVVVPWKVESETER